jgi:Protein of unknown function (DUF3828)
MRRLICALAAVSCSCLAVLQAATRIDDSKTFVTEVYRRYVAAQSSHSDYAAPDDIYTARLAKLIRDDRRKAKGEVGCLDFDFWVNGQDYKISNVNITSTDQGPDRKTIIAKFHNIDKVEEIRFDFRREAGRWLLDDVHSMTDPKWTLSEILKCTP